MFWNTQRNYRNLWLKKRIKNFGDEYVYTLVAANIRSFTNHIIEDYNEHSINLWNFMCDSQITLRTDLRS